MSEYGEQKGLQQILEDLIVYCNNVNPLESASVKIVLPKNVLKAFSNSFEAKERIVLHGEPKKESEVVLKQINYSGGGIVEIFSDETDEVISKDKT